MKLPLLLSLLPLARTLQVPLSLPSYTNERNLISEETKSYINELIERWRSSGLSMAVIRQNLNTSDNSDYSTDIESIWQIEYASFGNATLHAPVTPDTLFAIASNSKLFLAISVGLLIHNNTLQAERLGRGQKRLEWRSKIHEVIGEDWGLMDEDASLGVTIQDMLSHRTGLPRHDFSGAPREGGVREMIKTLRYLRPSASHRETFQYNNLMYESLSLLPSHLLGVPYAAYLQQHIFDPLNMSSTTLSVATAEKWSKDEGREETFANGFQWHARDVINGTKGELRATVPYFVRPGEEEIWAGAGGVINTAKDLAVWAATLLNGGRHPYTNEIVIPSAILDHVERGITVAEGRASDPELSPKVYGAGLFRYSYQGHEILEHGGNNPGFKTQIARFPHDNLAIVALSNDANGGWLMESGKWRVIDEVLGLERVDWNSRYEKIWNKFLNESAAVTPRPEPIVLPSQPIHLLEGKTFHHPAYGILKPCIIPSTINLPSTFTQSGECAKALEQPTARMVLSRTNLTVPTLIFPWKRTFATHLRLEHWRGDVFNVTVVWGNAEVRLKEGLFSGGSGEVGEKEEDEGAMLLIQDEHFELEWVHEPEEGLAFRGGFWGREGEDSREPEEKEGKGSAEVWFRAV